VLSPLALIKVIAVPPFFDESFNPEVFDATT
jgi:hypothetical protein